jgi:hypothetical protein
VKTARCISGTLAMMLDSTKLRRKKVSIQSFLLINFHLVSGAITSQVPDSQVVFNLVPKEHAMADIYCQLIPNDDEQ